MPALAGSAAARQLLESCQARLGIGDHYNPNGAQLAGPSAIIRQDRANFHESGIRDTQDEGNRFFAVKANRARFEAMLRAGRMDRFTCRHPAPRAAGAGRGLPSFRGE
ncbi:hypothetical protein [Pleomorphomonas koreensis]|uniref:hypothetical protein n=1 Tax=Pleomorphomonas koreensis TaxID=257440 RepID=UPI0003F74C57|nr:hypothetical protein [Pleomorphomonas koreensis]